MNIDNQINRPNEIIDEVVSKHNVLKLTDLALKNLIRIVLDKFNQKINEETTESLVQHYQPIREVIHKINQFDSYQRMWTEVLDKRPVKRRKDIDSAIFLLWQCFENFEAKQLFLDRLFVYDNKIPGVKENGMKFYAVINSQALYLKCESLRINIFTFPNYPENSMFDFRSRMLKEYGISESTVDYPLDQIGDFFEKIPNLIDININICAEIEDLCSKLIIDILPKYPSLRKLCLALRREEDAESFCNLAENHLRNLETLDISFRYEMQITAVENILKSLKHLSKLSTFKPSTIYRFMWPEQRLDSQVISENDQIQYLKKIELHNPSLDDLRSFHNWFTNLRSLVLTFYTFRHTEIHWSDEALARLNLQHFKNIHYLEFTSSSFGIGSVSFQMNIPLFLKQFPNLKIFVTSNFECSNTYDLLENKKLQKLIITEGMINPPKLLKKFPNLLHFRMKWPTNRAKKLEAINAMKLFLPPHCKLFEVVNVHGNENVEKEIYS